MRWIQSNQYDLSGATGGKYNFPGRADEQWLDGRSAVGDVHSGDGLGVQQHADRDSGYFRWRYYAGYFQDNWRVRPNLTLNLGVRYELETPRMEKYDNQAYIRLGAEENLNGLLPTKTAYCFSGACGNPRTLWPTNYKGIEPRIGFRIHRRSGRRCVQPTSCSGCR